MSDEQIGVSFSPSRPAVMELFMAAVQGAETEAEAAQAYADFMTAACMLAAITGIAPSDVSQHAKIAFPASADAVGQMAERARAEKEATIAGSGDPPDPGGGEGGGE